MSYNNEPGRAARNHPAAIIAIVLALTVAGLALLWWMAADPVAQNDINRIGSPEAPKGGALLPAPADPPPPLGTPAARSPPAN
ncbi:hypothetical protein ACEUZ9_000203 [Paracoccus litorisediminis]|uniref:hypothetical protein n=1 Tax=Paracoccus litorisediminis TaxID=2006130 RepID=UPI003732D286